MGDEIGKWVSGISTNMREDADIQNWIDGLCGIKQRRIRCSKSKIEVQKDEIK